jgi:hypothetical protein
MRPAITKFAKPHPVVFKTVRPKPVADAKGATPGAKPQKRDNIFSKSRDTREDRGTRQSKTSRNPQTLSRGR